VVPGNGVEGLPRNFFIEQLKDLSDPSKKYCEECSDDVSDSASRKEAAMFCADCQQRFCESCVEIHKKAKISRGHKLVDSCDKENIRAAVREMKTIFCEKHSTETIKVYCLNCKEAICMMCFVESHKLHECSDVNKVVDEFRQQMKNDIKNMNETMRKCDDALKEHEKNEDDFNKAVEEMEKEIIDRAEKLKKKIDLEKQKLLEELASRKADRMKEIEQVTENIERHMSFVMSLAKYTKELKEQGSASDVAKQQRTLRKRTDELIKTDVSREACDLGRVHVSLEAVKISKLAKLIQRNLIGRIKWQPVKGDSYNSPFVLILNSTI
jgi:transketolase